MPIDFPNTPTLNQTYTAGNRTWVYNGYAWQIVSTNVSVNNLTVSNLTVSTAFSSNVIPSANVTYDLGSSAYRWRELWLSGNTINLGTSTISADGTGGISVPSITTSGNIIVGNITLSENTGISDLSGMSANITAANLEIGNLRSNITAANLNIISIQSNIASQANLLNVLSGNAITQQSELASLVANAASQANDLTTLLANAATQESSLTTLISNAAAQSGSIDIINANVGSFNTYANTKIGTNTNSNLVVLATTTSTSSTTGALVVSGGVGIAGNLFVGVPSASAVHTGAISINTLNLDSAQTNIASRFGRSTTASGTGIIGWNRSAGRGEMAFVQNKNGGSTGGFAFYDWANTAINTTSEIFYLSESGNVTVFGNIVPNANLTYNLGSPTAWFNTFYGVSTQAKYADLAENYVADLAYAPGTVVIFGGDKEITTTSISHDTRVAGVISTNPGYLMNAGTAGLPVAFTGRVPCQVRGPVTKGTVLVTSDIPGVAEALNSSMFKPGCILGKSLENVLDNSIQTIEIVVGRF